jgi:hypothetical protein
MSAAALTPRVRSMVVCDEATESAIEAAVFNLEGVRSHVYAESFPWHAELNLFLLLSSTQQGRHEGKILVIDDHEDTCLRYVKFPVTFQEANALVPLYVVIGACVFPRPGQYTFQVYFQAKKAGEALKGELPFYVLSLEN